MLSAPASSDTGEEPFTCSGILVTARPSQVDRVREALAGLAGIRVHQLDEATGRLVVTQVAASDAEQAEGLRRLQRIEGVLSACLVYYQRELPESATTRTEEMSHG